MSSFQQKQFYEFFKLQAWLQGTKINKLTAGSAFLSGKNYGVFCSNFEANQEVENPKLRFYQEHILDASSSD